MAEHTFVVNQKTLRGMVGKISLNTSLMVYALRNEYINGCNETYIVNCKTGLQVSFKYWFTTRRNYVCQIHPEGTD